MKLEISQTLNNGFEVLGKNPLIFVPALVMAVLSACSFHIMDTVSALEFSVGLLLAVVPVLILFSLVILFLNGVIIRMVCDAKKGRVSLDGAARFVAGKYVTLLVASVVFGVVTLLGVVALFVPGFFLGVKLLFYQYAVLVDGEGVVGSLKKSWGVTKGNWWMIFALTFVLGMASSVLSVAFAPLRGSVPFAPAFFVALFIEPWYLSSLTLAYINLKG